jgi:hypothetical protein
LSAAALGSVLVVSWTLPAGAGTICDPSIPTRCAKVDANGNVSTVSSVGGTFTSASDGVNGAAGPSSSSQIGSQDGSGNLQPNSAANPLYTQPAPTTNASAGIVAVVSASAESNHVIKASPGLFYDAYVTTGATAGYFMAFNATTAPVDGAVTPASCVQVPANNTISLGVYGAPPVVYTTGVVLVFSSTGCFTKTASATAFFSGRVK